MTDPNQLLIINVIQLLIVNTAAASSVPLDQSE